MSAPAEQMEGRLAAPRAAAKARFEAMGLPQQRDEYWRYTSPARLTQQNAPQAAVFNAGDEKTVFAAIDALRLVFVDGVFDAGQSDDLTGSGIELLSQCDMEAGHWAAAFYGVLEARGQTPVARPLAALNSMDATEGVMIRVTGKAAKPVSLIYMHQNAQSDVMLHHLVMLQAGASLTLLENGPVGARSNIVLEADIGKGAEFHHIRMQGRDHERTATAFIFARLAQQSLLKSFTLTANGVLTRNEAAVEFCGDDAVAHLAGAALGDGAFHHDDTVFVTHAAPRCESRQVFKKVLTNGAVGVFQGKILVKQPAQKTDGYQISQALLLDDRSQFLAKPELEIYADDVKCSHGSTSGAIDETALYYLRSRGVPHKQAQSLLILAFLAQALEEIADPAITDAVQHCLEGWLSRHQL